MAERYAQRGDLINGRMGKAVITTEDGRRETMFYVKNLNVPIEISEPSIKRLGTMENIHFQSTVTTTWTATMYRSTRLFRNILLKFLQTGKETRFDLLIMQTDPNHTQGNEVVILKNCLVNKGLLIKLDIEPDVPIDEEISGSYESALTKDGARGV